MRLVNFHGQWLDLDHVLGAKLYEHTVHAGGGSLYTRAMWSVALVMAFRDDMVYLPCPDGQYSTPRPQVGDVSPPTTYGGALSRWYEEVGAKADAEAAETMLAEFVDVWQNCPAPAPAPAPKAASHLLALAKDSNMKIGALCNNPHWRSERRWQIEAESRKLAETLRQLTLLDWGV